MANHPVYGEIPDISYFVNCRGADFIPSYQSVWDKSGGIPTMYHPFVGSPSSYTSDVMYFAGSTRTSMWTHFNQNEVSSQIISLKRCGINLLRVPLDFYCWSALGSRFLNNAKYIANIATQYNMYVQWVLFECDTQDDVSGLDSSNRLHLIGGKDPETIPQAISKGLHYWQRCPTVYNSQLMTRHPSSLVSVGNNYLSSVIYNLSGYESTFSWEVMANVYFDSTKNPADVSAYNFLTSAISRVKSLKPTSQKVTASYKYLTTIPASPYYSLSLLRSLTSLDFVCYKASHITEVDRYMTWANALSSVVSSKKPILAMDVGLPTHFNFLQDELSDFYKLRLGWITDGVIDHNFSVKQNNNSKGLIFSDGQTRLRNDASAICEVMCNYLNLDPDTREKIFSNIPTQKTDYKVLSLQTSSYSFNDFTRLSQWGDVGELLWSRLKDYILNIPDYKYISSKYAPLDSETTSKLSGWELTNQSVRFSRSNFSTFFKSIISDFLLLPLATISNPISRDMAVFKRIHTLERLQKSLPITLSSTLYQTNYDPSFISYTTQQGLLDSYKYFKPISEGGLESIPYIGTPRYFSSLQVYSNNLSSMYTEPLENCQKPIGFFNNYTNSGSCFYVTGVSVITDKKSVQDVISKIDWAAYDNILKVWLAYIISAYEELFQMDAFSEIQSPYNTILKTILNVPVRPNNLRYKNFSQNILNIKAQIEDALAGIGGV